jgi:hypothetical protein
MTEYTTSSEAIRDFMSARERTAYWIQTISPEGAELYSPSVPPVVLDGMVPSSPPSETSSSHSLPPKMVLRYNDGRPDIPIPHPGQRGTSRYKRNQESNLTRSPNFSSHLPTNHSMSVSSGDSTYYSGRHEPRTRVPEEIRILPSYADIPNSSRRSHSRSKSLPRSEHSQDPVPDVPHIPQSQPQRQAYYPPTSQRVSFAPPSNPWHPRQARPKHPPAIIYAPSHHSQRPHYSPPAMFHHPPQMGPNGMIYSHSAPVPGQYPPVYPAPYPPVGSAHDMRINDSNDQMRDSMNRSSDSLGSGGTYYVIPTHGQKVHVIVSRQTPR